MGLVVLIKHFLVEIRSPYQLQNQREHINCDIIEYKSSEKAFR